MGGSSTSKRVRGSVRRGVADGRLRCERVPMRTGKEATQNQRERRRWSTGMVLFDQALPAVLGTAKRGPQ